MAKARTKSAKTYAQAGVSIKESDKFVARIAKKHPKIGGFAGAFALELDGVKQPVLIASTDGVGTKLLLAREADALDTIGVDLVAMVANDIITTGARPLFFLDYYAMAKLSAAEGSKIITGIERGCEKARMELLGGETAEMPGLYRDGDFDLAGFGVGIADKKEIIDGSKIHEGDAILGVGSSGVHSNGYSLVRAILAKKKLSLAKEYPHFDECLGDILLKPTRIYVKAVAALLDKVPAKGLAHITGGGIEGNLSRIIPDGLCARIDSTAWEAPQIFRSLQEWGEVETAEMFRVFNMGIGLVVVCREKHAKAATRALLDAGGRVWRIGNVAKAAKGEGKTSLK
jgi:phosphoribosylformylglycinamidine cyclo-ligase